jgi:hypothetical protein
MRGSLRRLQTFNWSKLLRVTHPRSATLLMLLEWRRPLPEPDRPEIISSTATSVIARGRVDDSMGSLSQACNK